MIQRNHLLSLLLIGPLVLGACGDDDDDTVIAEPAPTSTTAPAGLTPDEPIVRDGEPWVPSLDDTWQWQLEDELNLSYDVDVYDIDLFDTPASTIADLQAEGRRVICYYSSGSWEEWRDDAGAFAAEAIGDTLYGWEDERWLDVTHPSVRTVMAARLDLAAAKGCDAVEPDNVDAWDNDTGLSFTWEEQLAYNRWTAEQAHARALAVGLKNSTSQVPHLVDVYDFAVNEECFNYDECETLLPFIEAGKPVFHVEYDERFLDDGGCAHTTSLGFQSLFLPLDLNDEFRTSC
ncbi:MAG: endo alpha-1,4 polygalactosaminidase [Actinomycetota bacterium]